jgi:hypothetical protein
MTARQFVFLLQWGWLMLLAGLFSLLCMPMFAMHAWMERKPHPWRWAWGVVSSGGFRDFAKDWRKYG